MPFRYSDEEMTLRAVLKARRKELHARQMDIARAMGWGKGAASKYEQGEKLLGFIEVARLCRILSLDVSLLIRTCRGEAEVGAFPDPPAGALLLAPHPVTEEERRRLAGVLRSRRLGVGFTQAELARRSGFYRSCISKYEAGRRTLYFQEVLKLCPFLGLDAALLAQSFQPASDQADPSYGKEGEQDLLAAEPEEN